MSLFCSNQVDYSKIIDFKKPFDLSSYEFHIVYHRSIAYQRSSFNLSQSPVYVTGTGLELNLV